jgi:hypothetical protein
VPIDFPENESSTGDVIDGTFTGGGILGDAESPIITATAISPYAARGAKVLIRDSPAPVAMHIHELSLKGRINGPTTPDAASLYMK